MMRSTDPRLPTFALVAALTLLLGSCSSNTAPAPEPETPQPPAVVVDEEDAAVGDDDTEDGEYAFGTDRDDLAYAIESSFAAKGGKVTWEGDTLVLSVDGDAEATMAGFTECRVVLGFLNEGETAAIEFPNGTVECAEVLE